MVIQPFSAAPQLETIKFTQNVSTAPKIKAQLESMFSGKSCYIFLKSDKSIPDYQVLSAFIQNGVLKYYVRYSTSNKSMAFSSTSGSNLTNSAYVGKINSGDEFYIYESKYSI